MTPRRTLGLCFGYIPQLRETLKLCCVHTPPINDSSSYLNNTVYLEVILQASWHAAKNS